MATVVKLDNAASLNTVARNFLPFMFLVLNFLLFFFEMPGPTIVASIIISATLLVLCAAAPRPAAQPR